MKKTYAKPEIVFENFTLSENIAGDCESIVGNPSKGSCAVIGSGGINMFNGDVSACDFTPEDNGSTADMWDGYCYHVPSDEKSLFNS